MRTLLYTLLVSLTMSLFFCLECLADDPDEKLHTACLYPTIHVSPENKDSYGSGVIFRSSKFSENEYLNVFVTAAHVANSYDQYIVRVFGYENWSSLKGYNQYTAVFYSKDFNRDIAIGMFISEQQMPCAKIDFDTKLYIGTEVFRIGCGLGDDPRLDYGKITSVRSKLGAEECPLYRTSVHTVPGDSGGPLFNKYRVVGIARSVRAWRGNPVFNMSYYVPITCLREWSKEDDDAYHFVWEERAFPKMPFWELRFTRDYAITKLR